MEHEQFKIGSTKDLNRQLKEAEPALCRGTYYLLGTGTQLVGMAVPGQIGTNDDTEEFEIVNLLDVMTFDMSQVVAQYLPDC